MHKRRHFLIGSISLVLSTSLARLRLGTLRASVFEREEGGGRSQFFVGGQNASDSNPGTEEAPFATIQAAADVATPGTEVRIRDGIYRETVTPANSGTEEEPIVFTADTRADGTLAEPVISGAERIPDNAWALTATEDDAVLGDSGCYHADITLPSDSIAPLNPQVNIGADDVIISNQIFYKSEQVHLAAFPKKSNQVDLMDIGNYRDLSSKITRRDENDPDLPASGFWPGSTAKYIGPNGSAVIRWRETDMPNIDYTGAYAWFNINYLLSTAPISGSGSYVDEDDNDTTYTYVDINIDDPITASGRGGNDWWDGFHCVSVQVYGAKGLLNADYGGPNEWFYEPGEPGRLFIRPPVAETPSGVEYKARNWGFNLTGKSHIHLKHLNFFACELALNGDLAGPSETEGILIDYCRFKYLNWWEVKPGRDTRFNPWPFGVLHATQDPYLMQTGIRLTAANSIIRNSVIRQAAGNGVYLSGYNCTVENNWFSDIGIRGGYSAPINTAIPNPALITKNTVRRASRSAFNHIGWNKEVSYNDFGHCMCMSSDGGTIYSAGKWANPNLPGQAGTLGALVPNQTSGIQGGAFRNTFIHHNWIHSTRPRFRRNRPTGVSENVPRSFKIHASGMYFDASSDGAVFHHNVLWDNVAVDLMPGIRNITAEPPWEDGNGNDGINLDPWNKWAGKFHRFYNNTFASQGVDFDVPFVHGVRQSTGIRSGQYARNPDTVNNNIYLMAHVEVIQYEADQANGLPGYRIKPSEVGALSPDEGVDEGLGGRGNGLVPNFVNPGTPHQRFERWKPGDPMNIGGLRFQLQSEPPNISPGIGIGEAIDGTPDNGEPAQFNPDGTPLLGGFKGRDPVPLVGIDERNSQETIDAGAYQTGVKPWTAGCTLTDEFIEGEPWKQQWD